MQYNFSVRLIPNRLTAVSMHNRLRAAKAPVVVMGRFYSAMIERGLWVTQKELAAGLGVSTAHTSRMLAVARLPKSCWRQSPTSGCLPHKWPHSTRSCGRSERS